MITNNYPTELNEELLSNLIQVIDKIEQYIESRPIIFGTQKFIIQLVPLHLFKNNQAYYLNCHWIIVSDNCLPDKNKIYVMKNEDMQFYIEKGEDL